ncbi:MAG: glycosyltransferase family 61 protein, partial [Pseudomonadota bacterium]
MEALRIAEPADRPLVGGDEFPSDIGQQRFPVAKLQLFQDTYFNYAGDLFDQSGVMEASFPGATAYASRDVGRYQRRFDRRKDNCAVFDGSNLWITDQYSHFYYHWFCDALPRLAAALASHRCQVKRLLLPRRVYDKQYVRDSLKFWPEIELVVPPESGGHGIVENLLISTRVSETPMVHPEHVVTVADRYRLRTAQTANRQKKRRIYISRRNARVRRVENEAEIKPVLDRFGIETIAMEELPLDE